MFDDLDQLLKTRKKPEVSAHLSAQIIAAAARERPAVKIPAFVQVAKGFWTDMQAQLTLPRPAYAFAVLALFIFGALIGSSADPIGFLPGVTTDDLASFMLIEDGFVVGEWV